MVSHGRKVKNGQPTVPQSISKRLAIWFASVIAAGVMYWFSVRFVDNGWLAQIVSAFPFTTLVCMSMWLVSGSLEKRPSREEAWRTLGLIVLSHTVAVGLALVLTKLVP